MTSQLKHKLIERGYKASEIKEQTNSIKFENKQTILSKNLKVKHTHWLSQSNIMTITQWSDKPSWEIGILSPRIQS